jgi:hypothetical protein
MQTLARAAVTMAALAAMWSWPAAAQTPLKISTPHLDLTTYPSVTTVAPGMRFSVVVTATPHAHMHVYAPGASGYKVVGLKVTGTKYIRALPVRYPKSEIYEFKPLKEPVPAYQKPFTIVQQLTVDGTAATRRALRATKSLTITGRFEYQACDDGICYNPTSVPLTWTVGIDER